jgi:hypothetical protein
MPSSIKIPKHDNYLPTALPRKNTDRMKPGVYFSLVYICGQILTANQVPVEAIRKYHETNGKMQNSN